MLARSSQLCEVYTSFSSAQSRAVSLHCVFCTICGDVVTHLMVPLTVVFFAWCGHILLFHIWPWIARPRLHGKSVAGQKHGCQLVPKSLIHPSCVCCSCFAGWHYTKYKRIQTARQYVFRFQAFLVSLFASPLLIPHVKHRVNSNWCQLEYCLGTDMKWCFPLVSFFSIILF